MSGERRPKGTVVNAEPSPGEVEDLLRAAQDDLLLKLSVDTHTTTPSSLDPDLSRRFDALRSHRVPSAAPKGELPVAPRNLGDGGAAPTSAAAVDGKIGDEDEGGRILGEDLATRFAALKGSSSSYLPPGNASREPDRILEQDGDGDDSDDRDDDGVSKKEVEKLMQWALDAARLDPDPSDSDEELIGKGEGGGGGEGGGESEQDDEDAAVVRTGEKKKAEEGKKPPTRRKWFFF